MAGGLRLGHSDCSYRRHERGTVGYQRGRSQPRNEAAVPALVGAVLMFPL